MIEGLLSDIHHEAKLMITTSERVAFDPSPGKFQDSKTACPRQTTTSPTMIPIPIPDYGDLELQYIVTDYNGTLAVDGLLLPGVTKTVRALAPQLEIHVITADTFGLAKAQLADLPVTLTITTPDNQAEAKLAYVQQLGAKHVVAIGNGRNDRKMLEHSALGIALIQREGASAETLRCADVICSNIVDALDLLQNPKRLKATLCS